MPVNNHDKERAQTPRYHLLMCLLFGALGTAAVIMMTAALLYWQMDFRFFPSNHCSEFRDLRFCFYGENVESSTYLGLISGFYGTIVTLLLAVVALVAGFAFVVVRVSAFQHAETAMADEVQRYFATKSTADSIAQLVSSIADRKVGALDNRIEKIEIALQENGILEQETLDVGDEQ